MGNIGLAPAELTGVFLESTVYGVYFVLFIGCMYTLLGQHKRKGIGRKVHVINRPMFVASIILFISITSHWIIEVARLYSAYVAEINFPGPDHYYANLAHPLNVTKTGFYVVECLVADCIIVYRLYTVWNGNRAICIFPTCTLFALTVSGVAELYQFTRVKTGEDIFTSACGRWIISYFSFTLATNLYCTALIAFRIWRINRTMLLMGQTDLTPVIMILVESGSMYTFMTILTMALYLSESNAQFAALNTMIPVIGLAFNLIVVRVSLGMSHNGLETTVATVSRRAPTHRSNSSQPIDTFIMEPMAITVRREVEEDRRVDFKYEDKVFQPEESSTDQQSTRSDRSAMQP